MNLKQLEYFVRVAELGSFSKAAMILNIAQPALSRQVRLLETDLHVNLLTRTGRGVVLTEVGQRLFDHSVGILQLVARATEDIESARDEPAGRIVIGLPPSMGRLLTPPLVDGFRRSLPKARLAVVEACPPTSRNGSPPAASTSACCTTPNRRQPSKSRRCSTSRSVSSARPALARARRRRKSAPAVR
jgi:hypothetical protein